MEIVPKEELLDRTSRFQKLMRKQEIDIAIIVGSINLYYFTGSCQSGHLIIPAEGEPLYLVKKSFERAKEESMLDNIQKQESFKNIPDIIKELASGKDLSNKIIGMELDILPAGLYFRYEKLFDKNKMIDISREISFVRAVKSSYEVGLICEAGEMHNKVFDRASELIKEGITEIELSAELEAVFRKQGHQGVVPMRGFNQQIFFGHLMSGENLTTPSFVDSPTGGSGLSAAYPQGAGWKTIKRNEPVMVDHAAVNKGYIADQTRIFCHGTLPEKLEKAYEVTKLITQEVQKTAESGVHWSLLYDLAFEIAEAEGFGEYFMGYKDEKAAFVGHGVGLELDELPVLASRFDKPLEEGMVFALEPKMFFPGEGVVGVENTFLVREDGLVPLTKYPDNIIYLED
ncbi:M24 family metallopeptidase [Natranaerofaba carboxydovora]|uniref:M24 family metallopeptidase n=1 Tax=Natranaerofaba carboxydovora TaxID=2742683 RepID=UPI001F141336|nr:Xaa-Pro peptidase family protein [Natranaerofaba carboxydovora]UMZ74282.1 Xaa-Pro dipeptidase [Natranaerofaba carboxydovora]